MVRVTAPITHLCPFKEERDLGSVLVEHEVQGEPIELHWLSGYIKKFADQTISHEDLTQLIADELNARVVTTWTTGGLDVEVEACASISGG